MTSFSGHILHPYEDYDLTFGELKQMLELAAKGTLREVYEKIDGFNILFSFNPNTRKLFFARSKKELLAGGLEKNEIIIKFKDKIPIQKAFVSAYEILERAITAIPEAHRSFIFGNKSIWYSSEIIYTDTSNALNYDQNCLIFHNNNAIQIVNSEIKKLSNIPSFGMIESFITKMQNAINETNWKIYGPIVINLKELTDGTILQNSISQIDNLMNKHNLKDYNTLYEFLSKQIIEKDLKDLILNDSNTKDRIAEKLIKKTCGTDLKQLKREVPAAQHYILKFLMDERKDIVEDYMMPLETIIYNFTKEVLRGIKSTLITDHSKENERIKNSIQEMIDLIIASGDTRAKKTLNKFLRKVSSLSDLEINCEGIVFRHCGKTYKFTGVFAPYNALNGVIKYKIYAI